MALPRFRDAFPALRGTRQERDAAFAQWLDTRLGHVFEQAEVSLVEQLLSSRYGYRFLAIGDQAARVIVPGVNAGHIVCAQGHVNVSGKEQECRRICRVVFDGQSLPFDDESMDTVFLHHGLDLAANPHRVLREAARVVRPGGQILVAGFNPYSIWGFARVFLIASPRFPWCPRYLSPQRLSDWLQLLDFDVEGVTSGLYCWPTQNTAVADKLDWVATFLRLLHRESGAFYLLLARKQVARLLPVRTRALRSRAPLLPVAVAGRVSSSGQRRNSDEGVQ